MNQQERADDDGNWVVFALPAGEYSVTAHVPGEGIASAHVTVPGRDVVLQALSGTGSLAAASRASTTARRSSCRSRAASPTVARWWCRRRNAWCRSTAGASASTARVHTVIAYARTAKRMQPVQVEAAAVPTASFDLDLAPPRPKTVRVSVVDDHDAGSRARR